MSYDNKIGFDNFRSHNIWSWLLALLHNRSLVHRKLSNSFVATVYFSLFIIVIVIIIIIIIIIVNIICDMPTCSVAMSNVNVVKNIL